MNRTVAGHGGSAATVAEGGRRWAALTLPAYAALARQAVLPADLLGATGMARNLDVTLP